MRVQLLGPVEAYDGQRAVRLGGEKQRTVFAVLCAEPGRPVSRDRLAEAVWGDDLPERRNRTLATYLSNLRRVTGEPIEASSSGYRIGIARDAVDACAFIDTVSAARKALPGEPSRAATSLRNALDMWIGEPFGDVDGHWVLEGYVAHLMDLRDQAQEMLFEAEIVSGRVGPLLGEMKELLARTPHRDKLRALLMHGLYVSGRQTEALRVYNEYRDLLRRESGLDPSPEIQIMETRILQQDPSLGTPRLEQSSMSTLPARYSTFIGRTKELELVESLATEHRLVTITGPGGIGKSSLAIEAINRLAPMDLPPVWVLVDTALKRDLVSMVASAVGLSLGEGANPLEAVIRYLKHRSLLLLMDGCEPVISEAASLVDALLTSCRSLRVIATSREPLGLLGERVLRVGAMEHDDALRLFEERAEVVTGDVGNSANIDSIVRQLDGVPLALELVAARSRIVPVDDLLRTLDDRPQTPDSDRFLVDSLNDVLLRSYAALAQHERFALRVLSVFRQGFDKKAADAVVGHPDSLSRLVEVSFIQTPDKEGRLRMLEPIRQFAFAQFDEDGLLDARRRHATFFADESDEIFRSYATQLPPSIRQWIVKNRSEIASALDWAVEVGELDGAVRIIANLGHFLGNSGYADVAFPLALKVIDSHEQTPSRNLVVAMTNTSRMMIPTRPEVALVLIARAEALANQLGDEEATGRVLLRKGALGLAHYGADERARATIEEGIAHLKFSGALDWRNWYYNLALCCIELGDLAEAQRLADLRLHAEQVGLTEGEGWTEYLFGALCGVRGEIAEAAEWLQRAALREEKNGMPAHAEATWKLVSLYQSSIGRLDEASASIRRSKELAELTGTPLDGPPAEEIRIDAMSGRYEVALDGARKWFQGVRRQPSVASETGQAHLAGETGNPSGFVLVLLAVATSWIGLDSPDLACRLAASAPSLLDQTKFNAWTELGDTARWEDLRARSCQDAEPVGMSLQQAFNELASNLLSE